MKKEKQECAAAGRETKTDEEIDSLLNKFEERVRDEASGKDVFSPNCQPMRLRNRARVKEARENLLAALREQTGKFTWKERIELHSIIGFAVGTLTGISCQVQDDLKARINRALKEIERREAKDENPEKG